MQLRNVSPLQLPSERSVQENRAKWLLALLVLLLLSFKDVSWNPLHTASLC